MLISSVKTLLEALSSLEYILIYQIWRTHCSFRFFKYSLFTVHGPNKKAELLSFVRYENDDLSILTFYNTRETLSILANCKNSLYICAEHMLQEVSSECQVLVNFKDKFGCLICVKLHVLCCPSIQCR